MKRSHQNYFKCLRFITNVLLGVAVFGCSSLPKRDEVLFEKYESLNSPEDQRRQLPSAIRSQLTTEEIDSLELFPLATSLDPSKIGFRAK